MFELTEAVELDLSCLNFADFLVAISIVSEYDDNLRT